MASAFSYSQFRQQSLEITRDDHVPRLSKLGRTPSVMFLGTSMLESMGTTGQWQDPNLWPSEAMMSRKRLTAINKTRIANLLEPSHRVSGAFNAGCGGDRIENILYRLIGVSNDAETGETTTGLRETLMKRAGEVKLWVVDAGTNDLTRRKGLTPKSILALRELLLTIFDMSSPGTLVLLLGIFCRTDVNDGWISQANEDLSTLASSVAKYIEERDRRRMDMRPKTAAIAHNRRSRGPEATGPTEEDVVRHDSAVSYNQSVEYQTQAGNGEPKHIGAPAKVNGVPEIVELEKNIARFDFAVKTEPVKPQPRVEFLPTPNNFDREKYDDEHGGLNLEGYQAWMETLFPKVREMLDRAEGR